MVYRGVVKDGVVVLGEGANLPDGTEVHIAPVAHGQHISEQGPTLTEQFGDVIGTVPELPPDMAARHDHYLHGAPQR